MVRFGDVISKSFNAFGTHAVAFIVLTAIANIPSYVFNLVVLPRLGPHPLWLGLSLVVGFVCGTVAQAAITSGTAEEFGGRPVPISKSLALALRRMPPLVGIGIFLALPSSWASLALALRRMPFVEMAAGLLLIVVALIVICMFFVAAPVCIAEQAGVGTSLSRSRFLTRSYRWHICGALMLLSMPYLLVKLIMAGLIGFTASQIAQLHSVAALYALFYASQIVNYAAQAPFDAFEAVLCAIFYYQLRLIKEGGDVAKIASVFD